MGPGGALATLIFALLGEQPYAERTAALRVAALETKVRALEAELALERERRLARELEWLEFTRALAQLGVATPAPPAFLAEPEAAQASELEDRERLEQDAADARERRRAEELRLTLRAHLHAEHILGLDVLDIGTVHAGWVGPVVLRTLDPRGQPTGTLVAERLRLETSRIAHVLTLVLEEGYERRGTRKEPFGPPAASGSDRGGVRRIDFTGIDPRPWIEALPELFDPASLPALDDDGHYDVLALRTTLDALIRAQPEAGRWRLRALAGVVADEMRGVELAELDGEGRPLRLLLADRLRVRRAPSGVVLELSDGAQVRGERSAPFLQGVYRIYLPGAEVEAWKAAAIPGL